MNYKKYRGLLIPDIDSIKGLHETITYNLDDQRGACILASNKTGFQYLSFCKGITCNNCIFYMDNIRNNIDYLLQKGYIDKPFALKFSLDNLSNKE